MSRRLFAIFLTGACALPILSQTRAVPAKEDLAIFVYYSPFFEKVAIMEALADKAEASGKDPLKRSRAVVKQGAKLTDAEGVAKDYKTSIKANRELLRQHRAQAQAYSAQGQPLSDQFRAQGMDLNRNIVWIVLDRVQQLKSTLGDARFSQLDRFVHTWVRPGTLTSIPTSSQQK